MAEQPQADGDGAIDLRIMLQQSTDGPADITFSQLALSTTVAQLKLKIKDKMSSHPEAARMRLIWRGRVLANSDTTLKDVFVGNNARPPPPSEVLHLVIRQLHGSASEPSLPPQAHPSPPRATSAQNIRQADAPNPVQRTLHHNVTVHTVPPGQDPMAFHHEQHLRALERQNLARLAATGQAQGLQIPENLRAIMEQENDARMRAANQRSGSTTPNAMAFAHNAMMGARAPSPNNPSPNQAAFNANGAIAAAAFGAHPPPTREDIERELMMNHRMINFQRMNQRLSPRSSSQPPSMAEMVRNAAANGPGSGLGTPQSNTPPPGSTVPTSDQHADAGRRTSGSDASSNGREITALQSLTNRLEHTERDINNLGNILTNINSGSNTGLPAGALPMQRLAALQQYEVLRNHARTLMAILDQISQILRNMATPENATRLAHTVEQANDLRIVTERLRTEARSLESRVNSMIFTATANSPALNQVPRSSSPAGYPGYDFASRMASRAVSPAPPIVRTTAAEPMAATPNAQQSQDTPLVYLLNSAQGPQALLVRDDQVNNLPNAVFPQPDEHVSRLLEQLRTVYQGHSSGQPASPNIQNQPNADNATNNLAGDAAPPNGEPRVVVHRADAGANANGGLLPLLAAAIPHVWFVLRIAFFVYFFSAGLDWRRLLTMSVIGLGVWLIHIGLFDARWEGVRRRFEGLVMEDGNRGNLQHGQQAQPNGAQDAAGPVAREIRPEDTAARLLAAREAENTGWVRERARTVERAAAMFIASLWPGVGERQLRARDEARRRAEEAAAPAPEQEANEGAPDANAGAPEVEDDVRAMFVPAADGGGESSATNHESADGHSGDVEAAGGSDGLRSRQPRPADGEN